MAFFQLLDEGLDDVANCTQCCVPFDSVLRVIIHFQNQIFNLCKCKISVRRKRILLYNNI